MNTPASLFTGHTLTVFHNGTPITADASHPEWSKILDAFYAQRWDDVIAFARPIVAVTNYLNGDPDFIVNDHSVTFKGAPIDDFIASRLLAHMHAGIDTTALANFIRRLQNNPDYWIAKQLYPFLEKGQLPLTPDGCFLAYKRVRDDYTDVYSGTVSYTLGSTPFMARQQVDNDRNVTCSYGLHACSLNYLQHFNGDRIVAVKIDPADVVSIPADYNDTKLRCCRMEVVAELPNDLVAPAWSSPVFNYDSTPLVDERDEEDHEEPPTYYVVRRTSSGSSFTSWWDHVNRAWQSFVDCDCFFDTLDEAQVIRDALATLEEPDVLIQVEMTD